MSDPVEMTKAAKKALEDAGMEVNVLEKTSGICERCGVHSDDLAYMGCFICGMWEDPQSSDLELFSGVIAAFELEMTFDQWIEGRERYGHLVPSKRQRNRILRQIKFFINQKARPWIYAHESRAGTYGTENEADR